MALLSSPLLEPLSRQIKYVVLLLHGYGASGDDLISLTHSWQSDLPDTLFIAPNASESCPANADGYQWFPLPDLSPDVLSEGVESALPGLHAYIDQILARYQLQENQLGLVGFSQGAMMALAAGLSRSSSVGAVVGYSGGLVYPETMPMTARPPILLVHGDRDDLVPFSYLEASAQKLEKKGVPVTTLICQNIGHWIDSRGLQGGGAFLRQQLILSENTAFSQRIREK